MKKVIIISSVAAVVAGLGTGIGVGVKKNSVKRAMFEEFDSSVKAMISDLKQNSNLDLNLVHKYETSLIYKAEHNIPLKVEDGIAVIRNIESEVNDILYRVSMIDEESKEQIIRTVSDIMLSSIDTMEREIQRKAEQKAAIASAVSSAIELTGNVATTAVATAAAMEKMEERKENKERIETKEEA